MSVNIIFFPLNSFFMSVTVWVGGLLEWKIFTANYCMLLGICTPVIIYIYNFLNVYLSNKKFLIYVFLMWFLKIYTFGDIIWTLKFYDDIIRYHMSIMVVIYFLPQTPYNHYVSHFFLGGLTIRLENFHGKLLHTFRNMYSYYDIYILF